MLQLFKHGVRELQLHLRVLGYSQGFWGWFRTLALRQSFEVTKSVAGVPHTLVLRTGTSDLEVYKKIFLDLEYELPFDAKIETIIDLGANTGLASFFSFAPPRCPHPRR